MKILHTGDWHIGKLVHGLHMTEDQRYLLDAMLTYIKAENIDVLIIAGDVYDRSVPPVDAVNLLDDILTKLIMVMGVKVIAISGNHDSPERLAFGSKLLCDNGLYICGDISREAIMPIVIEDAYGPVNFYPLPFAEPAVVRGITGDESIKSHDDAIGKLMDGIKENFDDNARNICISHAFVIGDNSETIPESSDSERILTLGGAAYVKSNHFMPFDYAALGHIHRPQRIGSDHIRYAGSLLKYSFSEATQKKSVTLIELEEKGIVNINQHSFKPKHDMRIIKGNLDELLTPDLFQMANAEDYIQAILTDQGALYEPMKKMRAVYPNMLEITREKKATITNEEKLSTVDIKRQSDDVIFERFFTDVSGEILDSDSKKIFNHIYNTLKSEEEGQS